MNVNVPLHCSLFSHHFSISLFSVHAGYPSVFLVLSFFPPTSHLMCVSFVFFPGFCFPLVRRSLKRYEGRGVLCTATWILRNNPALKKHFLLLICSTFSSFNSYSQPWWLIKKKKQSSVKLTPSSITNASNEPDRNRFVRMKVKWIKQQVWVRRADSQTL